MSNDDVIPYARASRIAPVIFVQVVEQGEAEAQRLDLTGRVTQLKYEEDEKAADKATLSVDNFYLDNLDDPIWRKGNKVEIAWGYPGNMTPTRTGTIQSVKGFAQLTIEVVGNGILMNKTQKVRTFSSLTRSAVVAQIAKENGYDDAQQHIEDTVVVYETILQTRETDAQFVMRLAKREGFEFFIDFDGYHFHRRKLGQTPIRKYVYYPNQTPGTEPGDVLSIGIDNDVTAKPAAITFHGRDPITKTSFTVTGSNTSTQRTGLAPVIEVVDPATGATTLQQGTGQSLVMPTTEPNAAAAQRVANGMYINASLLTVEATIKAVGDPGQLGKTVIDVQGIRSYSGKYYVSKVTHTVGAEVYTMELKTKRDGRSALLPKGQASAAKQNNAPGVVDPNKLEPREVVDPRTGATKIVYVDSHGRPQG